MQIQKQMLSGISWSQYFAFCGTILTLYYLVLLVISRKDLLVKFKNLTGLSRNTNRTWFPQEQDFNSMDKQDSMQLSLFDDDVNVTQESNHNLPEKQGNTEIYYPVVNDLEDEIQSFLEASGESSDKLEVLESLKRMLQKYAVLKGTSATGRINKLIVSTCENYCSIHLNEDEVSELWS